MQTYKYKYNTVTVGNALIKADWGLKLPEYRLMSALLVKLRENNLDNLDNYIAIDVKSYAEEYGLSPSTTYRDFTQLMKDGMSLKCTITSGEHITIWNYIRSIRYSTNGNYILEVMFEQNMLNMLIPNRCKGNYTNLKIRKGEHYADIHTATLYRLLKEQTYKGKIILSIEDIRKYLQVKEGEYLTYRNLNSRIISTAIAEINKKSDITVHYKKHNTGKQTTELLFTLGHKEWKEQYKKV